MSKKIYVADSDIHGKGLFAKSRIGGGSLIGRLTTKPCNRDGAYVLWVSETQGFEVSGKLKYINHSNDPNACYYDDLSVFALRDIEPGEEITHDYESNDW